MSPEAQLFADELVMERRAQCARFLEKFVKPASEVAEGSAEITPEDIARINASAAARMPHYESNTTILNHTFGF